MSDSFLFYDLETFGKEPRQTRIAQFAAIRTDAELNQIEEPHEFFVQPAEDLLPSPVATLITGITPQHALHYGVVEAEAFARISELMSEPGTCSLGYNSIRFDDEFIRFGLYRNFHDAYEREWKNGNSRWDLLDVARLVHALRPEGIRWRQREDGGTSFKLEHLAEDNGLREGDAHEALSDVRATLGLARLIRSHQPRLWDYALKLRDKRHVGDLVDPMRPAPLLHVSQRYPAARMCAAPVLPLTRHPQFDGRVVVFDLADDPQALLDLDADAIAARLFVSASDLPEGVGRIGLKEVHLNRSPMLVQWSHLREGDFQRLGIDADVVRANAERLGKAGPQLAEKIRRVYANAREYPPGDPDGALYERFLPDSDRRMFPLLRGTPPQRLREADFPFRDARLRELFFRYRARNWPQTLSFSEQERWNALRRARILEPGMGEYTLQSYRDEITTLRHHHADAPQVLELLDALTHWGDRIEASLE